MGMNTPSRKFPRFEDERAVLAVVDGFRLHTLPAARWTHQAHLAVGLWHVRRFGEEDAKAMLRQGIRAYNEASGTPNSETRGYHETVTMYFIWAAARYLEMPTPLRLVDLVNDFVESRFGAKDGIFTFWSRDLLLSPPARLGWIEPNLAPLSIDTLLAAERAA